MNGPHAGADPGAGPVNGAGHGAGNGAGDDAAHGAGNGAAHAQAPEEPENEMHPAREMSLHLLRMLETRMDAAGIALQGETQLLMTRLQLKLLAAAAMFIAIWGGIVLLAIALPPNLRVPVLSGVVIAFVLAAVAAQMYSRRKASTNEIGSLHWFLDSLRKDLEVLSRALARSRQNHESERTQ